MHEAAAAAVRRTSWPSVFSASYTTGQPYRKAEKGESVLQQRSTKRIKLSVCKWQPVCLSTRVFPLCSLVHERAGTSVQT
jgi:hypothetical protein